MFLVQSHIQEQEEKAKVRHRAALNVRVPNVVAPYVVALHVMVMHALQQHKADLW